MTTAPSVVTTAPSAATTVPSAITTAPSAVTTALSAVTTSPSAVTTAPSVVTTAPSAVTTAPSAVTTAPSSVTTAPSAITTVPSLETTAPSAVTTAFSTTTYPPTACEDLMSLTDEDFNSLVVGPVNTSIPPSETVSGGGLSLDFENATETIVIIIPFPIGATLEMIDIRGTYDSYHVELEDENGDLEIIESVTDISAFDGDDKPRNTFNKEIPEEGALIITIQGNSSGFSANITEFRVCIEELDFCRLTPDVVYRELKFLPVDNVLGVLAPDNTTIIEYGEDVPTVESGVIIYGSCYECTCEGFVLRCQVRDNCECPGYTIECNGNCTYAMTIITYDEPGVPESCKVDETPCTPDDCTTPTTCPTSWTDWSTCNQKCQRHRTRSCEGCHVTCEDEHQLVETEMCDTCVTTVTPFTTTEPLCTDNEIYDCVSPYEECMEECTVFRLSSVCNNLDNSTDSCTDHCRCKDGYRRNMFGQCVQEYECECYNGTLTTPIPMNYVVNISECLYCECKPTGYECTERDDCCEQRQWGDWSDCSVTCGQGIRTRTRVSYGLSCEPSEDYEEQVCEIGECPCILEDGTVWESGKIVADECQVCTCRNGQYSCDKEDEVVPPWNDDRCEERCYCAENGTKICEESPELDVCREIRENCNNDTHILKDDPDNKCCPKCVPIQKPCSKELVENRQLNFTGDDGLCVSEMLPLHKCAGSCGPSTDTPTSTEYNAGLGQFKLFMESDCKCCRAETGPEEVSFQCEGSQNPVTIQVEVITACTCEICI